ncbi:MAG: Xaa-Pro peptidase family protein [Bacillota bacterium]|nr:Xaa-Pro peptidase family protein [Bacillota bacterium]
MELIANRVSKLQEIMHRESFDYLFLGPSANMFYFSGLQTSPDERLQLIIVPAEGRPSAVLPEMYLAKAESILSDNFSLIPWSDQNDPFQLTASRIPDKGKLRIAIDNTLRADHLIGLGKVFPEVEFETASVLVDALRVQKDEQEIKLMHEAGKIADQVMLKVQNTIKPGMSEKELVAFIEFEYKKLGDDISFKPIVASGPNGAQPHHSPGDRRFEKGDFIVIDCGALYKGYCSDITRTLCLGQATEEMKKVYNTVRDANEGAFQAFVNNDQLSGEEADQAARKVITDAGYGDFFIHRLGHGIGLEVHEAPYLVEGNSTPFSKGAAFTIEPGIYLSGKFGVRIEDVAVLTDRGPQRLTAFPRELIEI